jgi:hypothetical protein
MGSSSGKNTLIPQAQHARPQAHSFPCTNAPLGGGMESRFTHLAAWSSGIEASAVTEGLVHTLTPIEAGEQVCKRDTESFPQGAETSRT